MDKTILTKYNNMPIRMKSKSIPPINEIIVLEQYFL